MRRICKNVRSVFTTVALCFGAGIALGSLGCGAGIPGVTVADGQVFIDTPLSFDGSLTGTLADSQSTRASQGDPSAAQVIPLGFDTDNTTVRFQDIAGNDLLDPSGRPIPDVPVNVDGSFEADNLPVGVDFAVCGDIGNNGDCDIQRRVEIPSTTGGASGRLDGVRVDPLTTLIDARLRQALEQHGIAPEDIPISPVAVVTRIVQAFVNLFEDAGIDVTVRLEDILNQPPEKLAELFDTLVPRIAQAAMDIAEGNLQLERAADLDAAALHVAEVFLRAGFPIADLPDGPDFSALGDLDDVTVITRADLFPDFDLFNDQTDVPAVDPTDAGTDPTNGTVDGPPTDGPGAVPGDLLPGGADLGSVGSVGPVRGGSRKEVIYISTVVEPNRNFPDSESDRAGDRNGLPPLPVLSDRILFQMARLRREDRSITLGAVYNLLIDVENGLAARLTFVADHPNFRGPPVLVFETADGRGKAINLAELLDRVRQSSLDDLDAASVDLRGPELRNLLRTRLADTVPPAFDRLFGAFVSDRVKSVDELSDRIRHARVHLPFNRSGPSAFFVVADGDAFRSPDTVSPVTVDAVLDVNGEVTRVTYNELGDGPYFLAFTGRTEREGIVEIIVRETGRFLHGPRGPVRLDMTDETVFEPVAGQSFFEFVSEHGTFYAGVHITVIRDTFVPEPPVVGVGAEPAGGVNPPDTTVDAGNLTAVPPALDNTDLSARPFQNDGPNEQLLVLADGIGPDAQPVRVDYDRDTGIATFNPDGRHLLMFLPDSQETGLFALFNEETGRPARDGDPRDFFARPIDLPADFADVFNGIDDFSDQTELGQFADVLGGVVDELAGFDGRPDVPPNINDTTAGNPNGNVDPGATGGTLDAGAGQPLPVDSATFILVSAADIVGLPLVPETFTHVFGTDVPNERYDAGADPFFDDANGNGIQDPGEITAPFRPVLFDPADWRSTDVRLYYRRADNGESVALSDVDFGATFPSTLDGVDLLPRDFVPRHNAFRFGRPGTAINLLTAFLPARFFDGTHALNRDTRVDILSAMAIINLVMDQVFNIEAEIDPDGLGPIPRRRRLVQAELFVPPIRDPFVLIVDGFRERSRQLASTLR